MWTAFSACSCFFHVSVLFLFKKSSPVWTGLYVLTRFGMILSQNRPLGRIISPATLSRAFFGATVAAKDHP